MKKLEKLLVKSLTVLLLLGCIGFSGIENVCAQNKQTMNDLEQGKALYLKGRKMFYNAENTFDQMRATLRSSKESFAKLAESDLKCYWLSQVEFTLAEISEAFGDKKEAALEFSQSNQLAKKAIDYNDQFSDAYRLLADTYMRLLDYNGPLYTVNHGPEALRLAKKAFKIDNQNYTALTSMGVYYISAPKIGGGSIKQGIASLEKALASKDSFDKFIAHIWLGTAYLRKGNKTKALNHIHLAQEIYPNSNWAKELMEQCN
jgi:tetratricopeptide (TPR) repeat protein